MNRRVLPLIVGSLLLPLGCGGDDHLTDVTDETNCSQPREISLGQSLESAGDCQLSAGNGDFTDRWRLVLQDATPIQVQLSWILHVELFDEQGRSRGTGSGFMEVELEAGSYLIQVSGPEGPYRMAVKLPNDCSPEGELVLGETVLDALTDDDCVLNGTSWPYVFDTWTVDLGDTATVRRTMETS